MGLQALPQEAWLLCFCPSSPIGRGTRLKPYVLWVRIPRGAQCVSGQIGKGTCLRSRGFCGFDSRLMHHPPLYSNWQRGRLQTPFSMGSNPMGGTIVTTRANRATCFDENEKCCWKEYSGENITRRNRRDIEVYRRLPSIRLRHGRTRLHLLPLRRRARLL
jgi:hypothetical protein